MSQIDLGKETFSTLSVINDPFKFDKLTSINIYSRVDIFNKSKWAHSARVTFQNGNTEGTQSLEANTLDELIVLIRNFVIELNNNQ
jgi:hypothetical protein